MLGLKLIYVTRGPSGIGWYQTTTKLGWLLGDVHNKVLIVCIFLGMYYTFLFVWMFRVTPYLYSLLWRHNGHENVSNHQPHDCLLNRLFKRRSKKTSKLRVTGLCVGNSPGTGEFPAQMASNAEHVSIWWRHHVLKHCRYNSTASTTSCHLEVKFCRVIFDMVSQWYYMRFSFTTQIFFSFSELWIKVKCSCYQMKIGDVSNENCQCDSII